MTLRKTPRKRKEKAIEVVSERAIYREDSAVRVLIDLPPPHGAWLKVEIRNMAKTLRLYHRNVVYTDGRRREGKDDSGRPIPVSSLGRWIFGLPGYQGHAVFDSFGLEPAIWLPEGTPQEAVELLTEAMRIMREEPE